MSESKIVLDAGKYTVIHDNGKNLRALRYGHEWRSLIGDGLVLAMAQRIEELEDIVKEQSNKKTVTESIFDGFGNVITLADVSHIQRRWYSGDVERTKDNYRGLIIVTKHTTWCTETDSHNNSVYIAAGDEAKSFLKCWCEYRAELESSTLVDLSK